MTKQYDTEEQIEAFNAYVKRNPAGRQVHHTGTLGYEEDEWHAFQEGWNAALAQPAQEPVVGTKTWFEDGKVVTRYLTAKDIYKEPAQETVAKPYAYEFARDNGDGTYSVFIERGDLIQIRPTVYEYARPKNVHKDHPIKELFDHPPAAQPVQRPWVGLTFAEICECENDSLLKFAQVIEAKLKEKNT